MAPAVHGDGEAVGLVDHRQVPLPLGCVEGLPRPVGAQEISAHHHPVEGVPGVVGEGRVEMRSPQLDEVEAEALRQLTDPLRTEVGRRHHQDPVTGPAQHQLLHVQARHDRLAGARVVGQQVAESGLRQEAVVHRLQLVGQRPDAGDRQAGHLVREGDLDALRLDAETEPRLGADESLGEEACSALFQGLFALSESPAEVMIGDSDGTGDEPDDQGRRLPRPRACGRCSPGLDPTVEHGGGVAGAGEGALGDEARERSLGLPRVRAGPGCQPISRSEAGGRGEPRASLGALRPIMSRQVVV